MPEVAARNDTVERLLEAAESEFAARGFAEARLEDIAAAVGVRRASLLYHFATKLELYERVLARAFEHLRTLVIGSIGRPASTYAERLDDLVAKSIDVFLHRPLFARLLVRDALDDQSAAVERARAHVQPLMELGVAFVTAGQAAGELRDDVDPRTFLLFFTGAIVMNTAADPAQRALLFGRRALHVYRDHVRTMIRHMLVRPRRSADPSRRSS